MYWEAFGYSHVGSEERNEDAWDFFISRDRTECLAVIADGLGGHRNADSASEIVRSTAAACWAERAPEKELAELLISLVKMSHEAIQFFNRRNASDSQSTIAALWVRNKEAHSIHVGDTRVMQYGEKGVLRKTSDHTLAEFKHSFGRPSRMSTHEESERSILLTSLGGEENPDPELMSWEPTAGLGFVLSSDGFWNWISPHHQLAILKTKNPGKALVSIVHGSMSVSPYHRDNLTAIVLRATTD